MSRGKTAWLALLLGACLPTMSGAAIAQTPDLAARQTAGLERAAGAAGHWQMMKFQWDGQRNDWATDPAEVDAGRISFVRMDHGKAFRFAMRSPQFAIEGYLSFDVWTGRYVLVSIDDQIGQIDVEQGAFTADRLILDNLRADTNYQARAQTIHTRLELQFDGGQLRAIRIDSSRDAGQSWIPTSLFRVQRIVPAE